jgi:glutamate formiminotransferase/glutamate formiminotransferase/formiminotetrahydrofolate cyclodeaminase
LIIECVPNFSEGRDASVIASIADVIRSAAKLLDVTADADHNRSVLTFAGEPRDVAEAAFHSVRVAAERIDLTRHSGVHPRIGAADVVPFVPVDGATLADCAEIAVDVGERIWRELRVPVFLYESAARREECRRLENIRRLAPQGLAPDIGEGRHSTAGACVTGARPFLIAWNINLHGADLASAKTIAREIRESSGGLPAVKALGLPLLSRNQVQVSVNLVDFERTPLHTVFDAVATKCRERGMEIAGSELIGMIPQKALDQSAGHDLHWLNLRPDLILEHRLKSA